MQLPKLSVLTASLLTLAPVHAALSQSLQNILDNTHNSPAYTYPTDLTRGILPIAVHSHNDYWRDVPFYSALSVGAVSIEADVWLVNGTLYVGHEIQALTTSRTFDSLYIQPILSTIRAENPITQFSPNATRNGVYDASSGQTLYLFVDLKTDGPTTWPYVLRALEPLRQAGYLATANATALTPGPVTVIGTGNTPLSAVQSTVPRDAFYDAPLPLLNSTFSNITRLVSPIASTAFSAQFGQVRTEGMNATQLALLQTQVAVAHGKGIRTRYWDQPGWPIGTRNAVWRALWDHGVDLLNVDDLAGVAAFWENMG